VSKVELELFKTLKMRYPKTDAKRRKELMSIRRRLMKEAPIGD
jgi:hypothetical protein